MPQWWDRYPGLFEAEKAGLDQLGYEWSIDAPLKDRGVLAIDVLVPHEEELLKIRAHYPASYPYFQPQVLLSDRVLRRHHHPVGKNLCLLSREGEEWSPGKDTLASLLSNQLPLVLAANKDGTDQNFVAEIEDHIGEPLSSFLSYPPNSVVITPDQIPPPEVNTGKLRLLARSDIKGVNGALAIHAILSSVTDPHGKDLVQFNIDLPTHQSKLSGFWVRLPKRPPSDLSTSQMQDQLLKIAHESIPEVTKTLSSAPAGKTIVLGFLYPDETAWRTQRDDWLFLAVHVTRPAKKSRPPQLSCNFVRPDPGGEVSWMARAPMLTPLRERSAVLVGLGSLGAPLAFHLARAGIKKITLVDCDFLQVGNTIRWALGWSYAGIHKALAVAHQISLDYPYTSPQPIHLRLGDSSDYDMIRVACEEADIILDATASHRASHFLADLARDLEKPYLWLTTTHGTEGGVVGRIIPGQTQGCWHCFQHSLGDGSVALPKDSNVPSIQPAGCSQATFVGAAINSDEVSLLAGRLAVATLCSATEGKYPNFAWDVAVGDFFRDGLSIAPDWKTYSLPMNPACAGCNHL